MSLQDLHYRGEDDQVDKLKDGSFRIRPWGFDVTWGMDKRYWRMPPKDDPRKEPPLELRQVCWLEVIGRIKLKELKRGAKYNISFKIKMKPDAFGWAGIPIYIMARIEPKGKYLWRSANLSNVDNKPYEIPNGDQLQIEIPHHSPKEDQNEELQVGLFEVWKGRWKGGLEIYEAIVRLDE